MVALQKESFSFQLKGCSADHIMYVRGGEPLTADVQSLSAFPQPESDESQLLFCLLTVYSYIQLLAASVFNKFSVSVTESIVAAQIPLSNDFLHV